MTLTITYSAACLGDGHTACDWTATGPNADKEAGRHTKLAKHATTTHGRPA